MVSYVRAIAKAAPSYLAPAFLHEDILSSRAQIAADTVAGITVAIVLIPQAMAYALLLGIPPVNGLYAAFFGVLAGALWGSSRQMVTGPVGVMSLLAVAAMVPYAGEAPERIIALAAALAVMVGLVQAGLGFFKLGFLMRLVPQSVLVGFSAGAAVVIAITQLPPLLGLGTESHTYVFQSIWAITRDLSQTNLATALVGIFSITGIILLRRAGKAFPAALTVMVVATAASWLFNLSSHGVGIIGAIPAAFPSFTRVGLSDLLHFGSTSIVMALVGFMGSFSVAKSVAGHTRQHIDVDRELVGQGFANIASGLFRGYPVSGSFSISALNYDVGARTVLSSVVAAACVVVAILLLTPFLYFLPKATLAAVVVVSVIGLIKFRSLRRLYHVSRHDGLIAFITFFAAFLLQPQDAVMIGVVISLLVFLRNVMWVEVSELGVHPHWQTLQTRENNPEVETFPGVLIVRIDRSFIYANAERVVEEVKARIAEREARDGETVRAVICNCSGVNHIDGSGVEAFEELEHELRRHGIVLALAYLKHQVSSVLGRAEIFQHVTILHNLEEIQAWSTKVGSRQIAPVR